jgi:hypothetical protein
MHRFARLLAATRTLVPHALNALCLAVAVAAPAGAQTDPSVVSDRSLSGPRFGVTFLDRAVRQDLTENADVAVGPVISQFGWQFEKRFYTRDDGPTAVTEWVLLLGGLDQGVALPSLSWLIGVRTRNGAEFGVGPNVTPLGAAVAMAAGVTFRAGALNVPLNLAVVPSTSGVRVSLLAGFNTRR